MSISHDGKLLATGSDDGKVRVFELATTNESKQFETGYAVRTLVFAQSDNQLLTSGRTGQVEVWKVETGERTVKTNGHAGAVS